MKEIMKCCLTAYLMSLKAYKFRNITMVIYKIQEIFQKTLLENKKYLKKK